MEAVSTSRHKPVGPWRMMTWGSLALEAVRHVPRPSIRYTRHQGWPSLARCPYIAPVPWHAIGQGSTRVYYDEQRANVETLASHPAHGAGKQGSQISSIHVVCWLSGRSSECPLQSILCSDPQHVTISSILLVTRYYPHLLNHLKALVQKISYQETTDWDYICCMST